MQPNNCQQSSQDVMLKSRPPGDTASDLSFPTAAATGFKVLSVTICMDQQPNRAVQLNVG